MFWILGWHKAYATKPNTSMVSHHLQCVCFNQFTVGEDGKWEDVMFGSINLIRNESEWVSEVVLFTSSVNCKERWENHISI